MHFNPYDNYDEASSVVQDLRSSGFNLYGIGAASGMSSLGAYPTLGTLDYLQRRNTQGRDEYNRLLLNSDITSRRAAEMTANLVYGSNRGTEYQEAVRTYTQGMGMALNNPAVAGYLGGSAIDLGLGLQTMVGIAGARVNGRQVFGGGATTDAVAMQLYRDVQNQFFNGPLGMGNEKTFGLDKTEFGQMFTLLGQRGAFNGTIEATLSRNEDGSFNAEASKQTMSKLNSRIQDATKAVGLLKDVFGATKSISELVNLMEKIGGADLADPNSFRTVQRRIAGTVTRSLAMGMDPRAAFEMEATIAENLRASGFSTTAAGTAAGTIADSATRQYHSYEQARASGMNTNVYMPKIDVAAFTAKNIELQKEMVTHRSNSPALLALNLMQSGALTEEQGTQVREALRDPTTNGQRALREILTKAGYGDISRKVDMRGGAQNIYNSLRGENQILADEYMQSQLNYRSGNDVVEKVTAGLSYKGLEGKRKELVDLGKTMVTKLQASTRVEVAAALSQGGTDTEKRAAISQLLSRDMSGMSNEEQTKLVDRLMSVSTDSARTGRYFNELNTVLAVTPTAGVSEGDRRAQSLAEFYAGETYDDLTPAGKPLHQFLTGLIGNKPMSSAATMAYMRAYQQDKITRVGYDEKGQFTGNLEQALKGTGISDETRKRLEVKLSSAKTKAEQTEALQELAKTTVGTTRVRGDLEKNDMGLYFADADTVENIKKSNLLTREKQYESLLQIQGKTGLETEEEEKQYQKLLEQKEKGTLSASDTRKLANFESKIEARRTAVGKEIADAYMGPSDSTLKEEKEYKELRKKSTSGPLSRDEKSRLEQLENSRVSSLPNDKEQQEYKDLIRKKNEGTLNATDSTRLQQLDRKIEERRSDISKSKSDVYFQSDLEGEKEEKEYKDLLRKKNEGTISEAGTKRLDQLEIRSKARAEMKANRDAVSAKYGDSAFQKAVIEAAKSVDKDGNPTGTEKLKIAFEANKPAALAAIQSEIEATKKKMSEGGISEAKRKELQKTVDRLENAKGEAASNIVGRLALKVGDQWLIDLLSSPKAKELINQAVDNG